MVAGIHKGVVIEPIYERGQWRILVRKADGSSVRAAVSGQPDDIAQHWLSSPYADNDFGVDQVKHAIDSGRIA